MRSSNASPSRGNSSNSVLGNSNAPRSNSMLSNRNVPTNKNSSTLNNSSTLSSNNSMLNNNRLSGSIRGVHSNSPASSKVRGKQHRSQNWQSDHRTWQQRGGYHGYRIPDDRYRGYFGPDHGFRIRGLPFLVVGGYPRFQYVGYWISTVDPWPEYWGNDWYDTDDVYVNYVDNGYYLYNRSYPGPGIAINITL